MIYVTGSNVKSGYSGSSFVNFMTMKSASILTAALLLLSEISSLAQTLPTMQVVSVGDGDTIRVRSKGQQLTVRLSCIDAPELKQAPWGEQSKNRLKQLLPVGQAVSLKIVEKDKYGRTVAEVYKGDKSINLQLVEEGHAVAYIQYLNKCPTLKTQLLQAETNAKKQRYAFWLQTNPVMPWDFRRQVAQKPKPATTTQPQQQCDSSYPDICIPPGAADLDCGDIPYRRFRVVGNDPHGFDRDGDGIGCER
jgi:micrococcal nuclease